MIARRARWTIATALAAASFATQLAAGGCRGSEQSGEDQRESAARVRTESGLEYRDLVVGAGDTPRPGQTVVTHYTGWLVNGAKVDSSRDRAIPFEFPLGRGRVIRGWDEGVATMRVGGKRRLWVPAGLAYGEQGFGALIPPQAALVFEIELLYLR
jgi:peptidylprolyl isomerase